MTRATAEPNDPATSATTRASRSPPDEDDVSILQAARYVPDEGFDLYPEWTRYVPSTANRLPVGVLRQAGVPSTESADGDSGSGFPRPSSGLAGVPLIQRPSSAAPNGSTTHKNHGVPLAPLTSQITKKTRLIVSQDPHARARPGEPALPRPD